MLSVYRHKNIVSLLGFCDEKGEKILVYEYSARRSLDLHLNNKDLTWVRRLTICIGAARGLAYLHNPAGTQLRVLDRDIKSSNILLDENWNARIADLGLSKFGPANQNYTFLVTNNRVGTIGYCDPLYLECGILTKESDIYSFGVVLFEVLCGRLCFGSNDKPQSFTQLVRKHYKQKNLNEIIWGNIRDEIHPTSLKLFSTIAYRCLKNDNEKRPLIKDIITELETALKYQLSTALVSTSIHQDNIQPEVTFTEVYSVRASASKVLCCNFSSDGKLLASGGHDKKIVLWYTDSLKPKTTLAGHSSLITDVRFSPSMLRVATSSFDKTIRVWDVDNGGTTQVRFQPRHGRYLATVEENIVSILDVETQRCLHSLQGHIKPINSIFWDPKGQYLASLSEDSVRVWSFVSGNEGEFIHDLSCNGNKFHSCVFHPIYASLLVIGCYKSLELWNMSENKIMTLSAHEGLIVGLAASTVTGLVASASHDTIVKLWR